MCPLRLQHMLLRIQEYDFNISRLIPPHKTDPAFSGINISVNEIEMTP